MSRVRFIAIASAVAMAVTTVGVLASGGVTARAVSLADPAITPAAMP